MQNQDFDWFVSHDEALYQKYGCSLNNYRKEKKMDKVTRTCKDCGESFDIFFEEAQWLESRKLELFKRCKRCRTRRRELALAKNHEES